MNEKNLEELRNFYDNTDTSDMMDDAQSTDLGVRTGPGAMSAFTVRLPTNVLDAARDIAKRENVPTGVILRRFIEVGVAKAVSDDAVITVTDVWRLIAEKSFAVEQST